MSQMESLPIVSNFTLLNFINNVHLEKDQLLEKILMNVNFLELKTSAQEAHVTINLWVLHVRASKMDITGNKERGYIMNYNCWSTPFLVNFFLIPIFC